MSIVSFERTDAERTVAHRWDGRGGFGHRWRCWGFRSNRLRLIFGHILQECRRRHEKQISSDSAAEVEQPVVVARWAADEHVLKHLFDGAGRTAVADEVSAKFTVRRPAEGHVVAQDLDLFPILDNGRERVVR